MSRSMFLRIDTVDLENTHITHMLRTCMYRATWRVMTVQSHTRSSTFYQLKARMRLPSVQL